MQSAPSTPITGLKLPSTASGDSKEVPIHLFRPRYLPADVELTKEQIDTIRIAVVQQVLAYHQSIAEQNRVSGAKYESWLADYKLSYANDEWNRLHTQRVLMDHHFYSQFIFWTVILIVFAAMALTVYQFVKDSAVAERASRALLGADKLVEHRDRPENGTPNPQLSGLAGQTELSAAMIAAAANTSEVNAAFALEVLKAVRGQNTLTLGTNGLQLGTQLVGLVILSFALGFFYLYLEKVYPITVAQTSTIASPTMVAAPKQ